MRTPSNSPIQPLGCELSAMSSFIKLATTGSHPGERVLKANWIRMQRGSVPALKSVEIPNPVPELHSENPVFLEKVAGIARGIFDPRIQELASAGVTPKIMREEALEPAVLELAINQNVVSPSPADKLIHSARVFNARSVKRVGVIGVAVTSLLSGACAVHVIMKSKSWEFWQDLGGLDIGVFFLGLISFISLLGLDNVREAASKELAGYSKNDTSPSNQ